eukprot:scaffold462_cov195-Pinguiococcus_pyrenoidosus.AAC.45
MVATSVKLQQVERDILNGIDNLDKVRPSMLVGELSALISCQVHLFGNSGDILTQLLPGLPQRLLPHDVSNALKPTQGRDQHVSPGVLHVGVLRGT